MKKRKGKLKKEYGSYGRYTGFFGSLFIQHKHPGYVKTDKTLVPKNNKVMKSGKTEPYNSVFNDVVSSSILQNHFCQFFRLFSV